MKKKQISMILALAMTASMLLGGCSGAGGAEPSKLPGMDNVSEKVEETKDDEDKVIAKNEDKEEEKTEEVSGSGSTDLNAPFIPYVSRQVIHESDDSGSLFTSDYDLI